MPLLVAGFAANQVPTALYAPDNAAIGYSDYCIVNITSARARFSRPTVDGFGFENCHPAARIRFTTNSKVVTVRLRYNNLITAPATFNGNGQVLSNGVQVATFTRTDGDYGALWVTQTFSTTASRLIEIVLPYCASVDFEGVELLPGATLTAPTARPTTKFVAFGDSITHGFASTGIGASWPTILAVAKNWQLLNHGYGSRRVQAVDGTTVGNLTPDVATYLIGYNNFTDQTALATFKTTFKSVLTNLRAVRPGIKVYCLTPTWSPNVAALTLENYRQQIRDGLTELANALNVLVEGLPLATNALTHFPDGIHPNDAGSAQIAAALGAVVTL